MTIEVHVLDGATEAAYERFLWTRPESLIYYSLPYRDVLVDHLGVTPDYLVASTAGEVVGVLPTMVLDGPFGTIRNALPFYGSHGGPIAASPSVRDALLGAWYERVEAPGVAAATLVENPLAEPLGDLGADAGDVRIGGFTRLPEQCGEVEQALLLAIDGSARRNIRRARSAGVEVAVEEQAMAELHRLHVENMQAIGGRAKQRGFFDVLERQCVAGRDYKVFVARLDGEMIGGLLALYHGQVAEYFTPVTSAPHRNLQPTSLVLHEAMSQAARDGFRLWNWGGTWRSQETVLRFKRKWGATEHPYAYHTWIRQPTLLEQQPEVLLAAYPGLYVVPFDVLAT